MSGSGPGAYFANRPVADLQTHAHRYRYGLASGGIAAAAFRLASRRIREVTNVAAKAVTVMLAHKNAKDPMNGSGPKIATPPNAAAIVTVHRGVLSIGKRR